MPAPIMAMMATSVTPARTRTSRPGRGETLSASVALGAAAARRAAFAFRRRARWRTGGSVAGLRSPLPASLAATAIEPPTTTSVSTTVDTTSATLPVAPPEPPPSPPAAARRARWPWVVGRDRRARGGRQPVRPRRRAAVLHDRPGLRPPDRAHHQRGGGRDLPRRRGPALHHGDASARTGSTGSSGCRPSCRPTSTSSPPTRSTAARRPRRTSSSTSS